MKFDGCRNIYPVRIIKPAERFKYNEQEQLQLMLDDINDNDLVIDCCSLDNPKRAVFKCAKTASAKFGCEYCFNCAVPFVNTKKKTLFKIRKKYEDQEKRLSKEIEQLELQTQEDNEESVHLINLRQTLGTVTLEKEAELQKQGRKQLTWPVSTMSGNLRTVEEINEIANEIENNPDIVKTDPLYCKGLKGKSPMLDQPYFHFINDMPCEYMHIVCLSVVKRMVELNFKVGENRDRVTKRKLSSPQSYNEKIKSVQVTGDFSHRCRNLDFGVMKAGEFRNVLIFFFPIVLECIEDTNDTHEFDKDKEVWLHLVFMIRACVLPNNEFKRATKKDIESACKKFYALYEELFGQHNCTYSIHVVPSHLLKIRGDMPLTHKSAFKFESFFAEMRSLFHPGTVSPLKQILQNSYVKRRLENHHCEKTIKYCPENTKKLHPGKENNSLIYTFDENEKLTMYSIVSVIDENSFSCHIQGKFQANFTQTPEYNWSDVGVFKIGPISDECYVVQRNEISGKVLKVNGYLITCPKNVLLEQ